LVGFSFEYQDFLALGFTLALELRDIKEDKENILVGELVLAFPF
jgi:hypothetical protein